MYDYNYAAGFIAIGPVPEALTTFTIASTAGGTSKPSEDNDQKVLGGQNTSYVDIKT